MDWFDWAQYWLAAAINKMMTCMLHMALWMHGPIPLAQLEQAADDAMYIMDALSRTSLVITNPIRATQIMML